MLTWGYDGLPPVSRLPTRNSVLAHRQGALSAAGGDYSGGGTSAQVCFKSSSQPLISWRVWIKTCRPTGGTP